MAEAAGEIEDFAADLAQLEPAARQTNARVVSMPSHSRVKSGRTGHGAKYPRKKQEAILQLFKQKSIGDAARETGIGTQTLYQWMDEPEFDAECRAFERSVYGDAMTLARQKMSDAVTLIRNFSVDSAIPLATRINANRYIDKEAKEHALEDMTASVSEGERAKGVATAEEPEDRSKLIGRNLRQRLRQLKALLPGPRYDGFEHIHARDGKATGSSVIGPQGRHVWSKPPEGFKVGERVPEVAA